METKEKVNNVDIKDGKFNVDIKNGEPIHISEKFTLVFYYRKPKKESYYGYVHDQLKSAESGNSTLTYGMNTKVKNTPEKIAEWLEWLVGAVKYNPLNVKSFFITIVYNRKGERENILSDIIKGLNENEVFKNLRR